MHDYISLVVLFLKGTGAHKDKKTIITIIIIMIIIIIICKLQTD